MPAMPTPPPPIMPMMPAQGAKPRNTSTSMNPTILGALAPPGQAQTGPNTLLGQA
jgi:hypothetical protein